MNKDKLIFTSEIQCLPQISTDCTVFNQNEQKNSKQQPNQSRKVQMESEISGKDSKTRQHNRWIIQWSTNEDDILFQKYIQFGSKWTELVQFLPSKSDNAIKNRFYCCMRKVQRKMNKVQKQRKIKHRKLTKYESLLTFLQIGKSNTLFIDKRLCNANKHVDQIVQVRDLIIRIAKQPEEEINDNEIEELLHRFLELKYSLKFINIQRVKNNSKKLAFQIQRQLTLDQTDDLQEERKSGLEENEKQKDATSFEDGSFFDIDNADNQNLSTTNQRRKLSVLEECHDILDGSLKKQEFDYLFFL